MKGSEVAVKALMNVVDRYDADRVDAYNYLVRAKRALGSNDLTMLEAMIDLAMEVLEDYKEDEL